ncbi:MAG: ProQ/FINO family protein [Polaromonas sp.]
MTDTVAAPDSESTPETAPVQARQRPARQGGRGRPQAKPQNPARAPRTVHPVLQQLFELYPKMFGAHFLPLKLGVFQDLLALHPELFKRDELKVALGLHARSTRYLESVAAGLQRHDLNGEPVEPVAPEHVHHAIMEVFRRRQARANQDLRPYARAQLIAAIEVSGLSREDYLLCIRQQDEVSVALLDEAFAELAEQAAKRDALLRMFEASGKTVAEFSDMYGMNPDEVALTLERARFDQAAQAAAAAKAQELPLEATPADTSTAP